ncbi:hypothetical protein HA466_0125700 [Hirschfeldia incana]|nr:hypothetical protein HA466_0125700 [Hirschfeldia incana]
MSKKAAKKRAAKLEKLSRKREREEDTLSSSLPLSLPLEEDESFSSNYGDVTPKSAAGRSSWREAVARKEFTDVSNLVKEIVGSEVSIRGRVHNHRLVAKIILFVILRESGFTVQCVVEEARVGTSMVKFFKQLSHESVVELIGVVSLPKKPLTGTTQQDAARSEADIEKSVKDGKPAARVLQDTRLNNRVLDIRTPANQAIFRIQCQVQIAFREFLLSKGFLEIHTPKLMAGSSEGGSAVFRAEDSFTHRHLCEFEGPGVEMEIRMHYSEIMDLVGGVVTVHIHNNRRKFLPQTLRLTFAEGIQMLKEAGEEVDPLGDLNTESERKLGQLVLKVNHRYPSAVRPFYTMPCENDSNYSNSFEVFIRGEEIMSGAQSIHDPELLEKRARKCGIDVKTISTYDAFRYGAPPHGGYGVGLERVVMLLCALNNIRKTSLFPRDSQRLAP